MHQQFILFCWCLVCRGIDAPFTVEHSHIEGPVCCQHFGSMMNQASVNMYVKVLMWACLCCCWKYCLKMQFLDHALVPYIDSSKTVTGFPECCIIFQNNLMSLWCSFSIVFHHHRHWMPVFAVDVLERRDRKRSGYNVEHMSSSVYYLLCFIFFWFENLVFVF